jgi:hypothetical protein
MKRITNRWMTLLVVFVFATQCCCCIVTPVSGDLAQASIDRNWSGTARALAAWFQEAAAP